MVFRTEIEPLNSNYKFDKNSKILTIGSCFSDVLGNYLSENKLNCTVNPYGTIFNPISIFKLLNHSLSRQRVFKHLFAQTDDTWHHFDFHSKFWSLNQDLLESELNKLHIDTQEKLRSVDYIIVTLGTAWVYKLKNNQQIVANCHKQTASQFSKVLLSEKEILFAFRAFYEKFRMQNSNAKIILTVSPVRHTKDSIKLNSVSKASLRYAAHYIETSYDDVEYFPSYEIMMDDLRDYRFYEKDLIHPNETAHKYIIEKFSEAYFEPSLKRHIKEVENLKLAFNHRPLHESSLKHQNFLKDLISKMESFNQNNDFKLEIEEISNRLNNL